MQTNTASAPLWGHKNLQNLLYLAIGLGVFLLISWFTPTVVYRPCGIALPTTPTAIPHGMIDPNQVKLIDPKVTIADSKALASISVENHYTELTDEKLRETIEFSRKLAALAGANGLVVTSLGYVPIHQSDSALLLCNLEGQALLMPAA